MCEKEGIHPQFKFMKRYLTGLLALGFAITAFAFTKESKKMVNGKEVATAADPCAEVGKKWFLITLDCDSQTEFSQLVNAGNYTLSNQTEVNNLCMGISCVCAIYACQSSSINYPLIPQGSSIYTALWNFYQYGQTSGLVRLKDQYWGRAQQ